MPGNCGGDGVEPAKRSAVGQQRLFPGADEEPEREERVEPLLMDRGVVRIGTCGFSYRDWVGPFYPAGIRSNEMLEYYAQRFPCVEIDATYYRIPSQASIASMERRTPPEFRFTAKLPGTLTHVPPEIAEPALDDAQAFREVMSPLVEAGKLGAILLQFPNSFHPGPRAERHLVRLREALEGLPLVAEFRHRSWQSAQMLGLLSELGIGWCNVDAPRFETLPRPSSDVVGDLAYVRFHGRNAKMWWKGDNATRYDYTYTPEDLEPWAARVSEMADAARETYVLFNNHRFGQAATSAKFFAHLLRG
jgi:uncharacterized protein YecE (DUF72 family)